MTDDHSPGETPAEIYRRRQAAFEAEAAVWSVRSRRFSWVRIAVFAAGLGCLFMLILEAGAAPSGWLAGAGVAFAGFVVLVGLHDQVIARERRVAELAAINREARARLARRWDELPPPRPSPVPPSALARDLSLFGQASLFQLLDVGLTPPGRETLGRWLTEPAAPGEIRRRQEAVAELSGELELIQELARRARPLGEEAPEVGPFLEWSEDEPWLTPRRTLVWATRLLPVAALGLLAASVAGPVPWSLPALVFLAHIAVSHLLGERLEKTFDRISSREGEFHHYAEVFGLLEKRTFSAGRLRELAADLTADGLSAHRQMAILHQRVILSDARLSAPLHFVLQAVFLWDLHILYLLERWQARAGRHVRRWLEALGEIEALTALGGLAHGHPGWVFPEIRDGGPAVFEARGLGHPLLAGDVRIANDVTIGPPETFLLVTGSNMSGKSTLLRALGVNALLAQAGGPVCARTLTLPPVDVATSILIEDSLADGVSFFMAEILRIQKIVEAARSAQRRGRTLLYLLDEVLRGTNSRERRIAVRRILGFLLEAGAIGAVSTHDAALAEAEELAAAARPVYFRETVHPAAGDDQPVMTFDYRLREGIATDGNALALLELVGLGKG